MVLAKLILISQLLLAHDWYPPECCNGQDCKPVPCQEIISNDDGTVKYKETIFARSQRKNSPDGACHVCIYNGGPLCVFLPVGS